MDKIKRNLQSKQTKSIFYGACVVALVGWVIFRFAAIGAENALLVFNPARSAIDTGAPVYVQEMTATDGVLYEPVAVRNNRAYVSGARIATLRPGQKIGDGKIVSVSKNIDFDTGMYLVRTSGVADGLQYAQIPANGYFVPVYAVKDNSVMVVQNGRASVRNVTVSRQDAQNAYITSGLMDGDVVILSTIADGAKVQITK